MDSPEESAVLLFEVQDVTTFGGAFVALPLLGPIGISTQDDVKFCDFSALAHQGKGAIRLVDLDEIDSGRPRRVRVGRSSDKHNAEQSCDQVGLPPNA